MATSIASPTRAGLLLWFTHLYSPYLFTQIGYILPVVANYFKLPLSALYCLIVDNMLTLYYVYDKLLSLWNE